MIVAPLVGVLLAVAVVGLLAGVTELGAGPLLAAALAVGGLALATRGLHLDGLADTADGLGSAAPPERALAIMRSPELGALGVATLVLVLVAQVSALAQMAASERWWAAGLGVVVGRVALVWGCRRGVPAARSGGLGALVADTVPLWVCLLWTAAATAVGLLADAAPGAFAVLVPVGLTLLLVRHAGRRLGGVTGDVLGAAGETAVLASWVVLALGS
jgi:adenosylcobinamide-GDP ribazoletransferase